MLPAGTLEPATALQAAGFALGQVLLATAVLYASSVLPAVCVVLALLGIVGGWVYSMPPIALERRGWGEVDNAALGGFVMPLMAYASQTGTVSLEAVLVLAPIFGLVLLNLLGTHWPDRAADAAGWPAFVGGPARAPGATGAPHAGGGDLLRSAVAGRSRGMPREVALGILLSLPVALWAAVRLRPAGEPDAQLADDGRGNGGRWSGLDCGRIGVTGLLRRISLAALTPRSSVLEFPQPTTTCRSRQEDLMRLTIWPPRSCGWDSPSSAVAACR